MDFTYINTYYVLCFQFLFKKYNNKKKDTERFVIKFIKLLYEYSDLLNFLYKFLRLNVLDREKK
jgi:hypothetical protein